MKSIFLLWACASCLLHSSAQTHFRKGFMVTSRGDTLHGYFFIKAKNGIIEECKLYSNQDATDYSFIGMDSCKTIQIAWPDHIDEIWRVKRSMTYIERFDFSIINQDSVRTEAIYLECLYRGKKISLYHYQDKSDHFFVFDGRDMTELMVRYRVISDWKDRKMFLDYKFPAYEIVPYYIDQLKQYYDFSSEKKLMRQLNHCKYEEKELVKLFASIDAY